MPTTPKKPTAAAAKKAAAEKAEVQRKRSGMVRIVGAYLIVGAFVIFAAFVRANDVERAKELACEASLDNRELMAYVISNSQGDPNALPPQNLPPEIQKLIDDSKKNQARFLQLSQDALNEPIEICVEVGMDSRVPLPPQLTDGSFQDEEAE